MFLARALMKKHIHYNLNIVTFSYFQHGLESKRPLAFTHMDILASVGLLHVPPTGVPVMALTTRFIMPALGTMVATTE